MKRTFALAAVLFTAWNIHAQTVGEWLSQKSTQIQYLLQQIAANQVYIEYLQKGYKIARNGLNLINDIKTGDFNLHSDYFNSLKAVNPKIKNWGKVAEIAAMQAHIIKQAKASINRVTGSGQFTSTEVNYLKKVFDHLLDECAESVDYLLTIITSGKLEMKDDERIKQIDTVYTDMQEKLAFCMSFSESTESLALQRGIEKSDIEITRKLNGL